MMDESDRPQVVFVDANIPMYVAGRDHALREVCRQALTLVAQEAVDAVTNTEVHQEILHRYLSLGRPDEARSVSKMLQTIVPHTLSVALKDIVRARELSLAYPGVAARDLVHAAVMLNHGVTHILSVDKHFDVMQELVRLSPEAFVREMGQRRDTAATTTPTNRA